MCLVYNLLSKNIFIVPSWKKKDPEKVWDEMMLPMSVYIGDVFMFA